jgi:hypothetical protein
MCERDGVSGKDSLSLFAEPDETSLSVFLDIRAPFEANANRCFVIRTNLTIAGSMSEA